ncbi:MAG: hypothetical protein Q9160_005724 [Pyrenula sp. 1 TL-2023]
MTAMPGAFMLPPDEPTTATSSDAASASPTPKFLPSPRFQPKFRSDACVNYESRKRTRFDTPRRDSGISTLRDLSVSYGESYNGPSSSAPSPAPFANEKYHLVGGLDTPLASRAAAPERHLDDPAGWDRRSRRYGMPDDMKSYFPETPFGQPEGSRVSIQKCPGDPNLGWGKTMVTLVGGVINFCWSRAFGGFVAGGGEAYDRNGCVLSPVEETTWMKVSPREDVFNSQYTTAIRDPSSAPGYFPDENFIQDYMSYPEHHHATELSTPTRYNANADRDGHKWVFVKEDDFRQGECSPDRASRKVPKAKTIQPRPTSNASFAGRPKLVPHRPSQTSSPAFHLERSASYASPRGSPNGAESSTCSRRQKSQISSSSPRKAASGASLATPTSPDVIKFEKKIKMRDSMENAKINRANRHIQDMIKQGREALGSKVEVMDDADMEDEGYVEGMADTDDRW